jgi:hypothetical protein
LQYVLDYDRFENIQLSQQSASIIPIAMLVIYAYLKMSAATIVMASHCVGFTFPGIMLLPGSFSGKLISPNPQRGPEARKRMSLAIFIIEHAITLRAP